MPSAPSAAARSSRERRAAHKANVGDKVIIAAYCGLDRAEVLTHKPRLVYVNGSNGITRIGNDIPEQAA